MSGGIDTGYGDHIGGADEMVGGVDPCAGCVNRRPDGNYDWPCMECKRWYSDMYEPYATDEAADQPDAERSMRG